MTNLLHMEILQVLAFRDPKLAEEVCPALWAAFQEIELFYNHDEKRLECHRLILDPGRDTPSRDDLGSGNYFICNSAAESFWKSAQGRYQRTIDQNRLADLIREKLPPWQRDLPMVVVIDPEITPPPDWRYIIWDDVGRCMVISVAPVDPRYWREQTSKRVAVIKHRVRTAGLSATGELMGLSECKNENCFLLDNVNSTKTLDSMLILGEEHNLPGLAGLGFSPRPPEPNSVQRIERGLIAPEEWADNESLSKEWDTNE